MQIRPELTTDAAGIRAVYRAAFETSTEADLVDALRAAAAPGISLVALDAGGILGHIVFSPMTLEGHDGLIMGLAPMAVVPHRQREGIGSALVREGLRRCRAMGATAVAVLGHAGYYPRFGFVPASTFGLRSEYDVPDDNFMVVELEAGSLKGRPGTLRYHPAFAGL